MTRATVFDLASLTKPLFTAARILDHVAAGRIALDAPLTDAIPDLAMHVQQSPLRHVTFAQALSHETSLPASHPIYTYGADPATLRAFVLQRDWPVGPAVYSDLNFILLGIALERLEGRSIRDMDPGEGFSFAPDPAACAATELCPWRGRVLCGEVHDENAAALQGAGHAGLFGTLDAVLDGGARLLAQPGALAARRMSPTRTLGWEAQHPGWPGGDHAGAAAFGHTGFTGTGLWIDPGRGIAWALLTNRVHPTRHADSGIHALRRAVSDALLG